VLFQVVPIGVFNTAAQVCTGPLESPARAITALLVGWGLSSTNTHSVFKFGYFSSPTLRENKPSGRRRRIQLSHEGFRECS
jgi:hypothetical protein